jgi:nucleolar pre-ribosomal-associated protein 1
LINNDIKLAKVFRKLVAKESGIIGDVEKLSSAAAASLKTRPEAKSKFIKIIKNILQTEVDKFLRSNMNMSNQAIKTAQELVKMLISCYSVEIELKDRAEYEVENIHQLELIDAIFSASDSDDETKSWILIPSMKIAVATLKMNGPEDEYEPLFEIINRRVEQLHSLSSFYTNATHCEAWSKFVKSILKNALKLSSSIASERHGTSMKKGILALKMLTKLCTKLHSISNAKKKKTRGWKEKADADCHQIFNLICGHSNFLSLLYSKSKEQDLQSLKYELLNLMVLLINSYPKICEDLELTVFLGAYHGTLSAPDCSILQMIHRCEIETSGHERISKLAMLQPLLWGQAAVSKYSTLHNKMSKMTQSSEILQLIQPERMLRSALKLPLNLKMDISNTEVTIDYDSNYYDPRFFLPLICNVCTPGAYVDRHLKLIDSGVLALVFASFSSYDPPMRALGCTALCRVYDQIASAKIASAKKALSAEKQIWLHLIDVVKNGLAQQLDEQGVPKRVPSITTVFLARITAILSSPMDPMYRPLSSFILVKPSLEMFTVPEFSRLFHSQNIRQPNEDEEINNGKGENTKLCFSNTQPITERNWILAVIRDGLRDSLDFNILEQNFILKIVLTFFSGRNKNLQADASKHIILEILNKAVRIKDKALDLIKRHGFLLWLVDQVMLISAEHIADTIQRAMEKFVKSWRRCFVSLGIRVNISSKKKM